MRAKGGLCRGSYLVPVDDTRLHVTVAGRERGPVLLYLHGGAGHYAGDFQHFAGPWVEELGQVVYLDQRGCGASLPCPSAAAYSLDRLVADLAELHERLAVPPWHLVGHSFGGILAAEYARRHPEQVASLFLVSTAVEMAAAVAARLERGAALLTRRDPEAAQQLRRVLDDAGLSPAERYVRALGLLARVPELIFAQREGQEAFYRVLQAQHFVPNVVAAGALLEQGLLAHDLAPALRKLRQPVTAVFGREDLSLYDQQARRLAEVLPEAQVLALRGCGHYPYVEEPERLAEVLRGHLGQVAD
jgi:proline iminopeptidase